MLQIVDFPRTQKLTRLVNLGHNSTSLQLGSWAQGRLIMSHSLLVVSSVVNCTLYVLFIYMKFLFLKGDGMQWPAKIQRMA